MNIVMRRFCCGVAFLSAAMLLGCASLATLMPYYNQGHAIGLSLGAAYQASDGTIPANIRDAAAKIYVGFKDNFDIIADTPYADVPTLLKDKTDNNTQAAKIIDTLWDKVASLNYETMTVAQRRSFLEGVRDGVQAVVGE